MACEIITNPMRV